MKITNEQELKDYILANPTNIIKTSTYTIYCRTMTKVDFYLSEDGIACYASKDTKSFRYNPESGKIKVGTLYNSWYSNYWDWKPFKFNEDTVIFTETCSESSGVEECRLEYYNSHRDKVAKLMNDKIASLKRESNRIAKNIKRYEKLLSKNEKAEVLVPINK